MLKAKFKLVIAFQKLKHNLIITKFGRRRRRNFKDQDSKILPEAKLWSGLKIKNKTDIHFNGLKVQATGCVPILFLSESVPRIF